MNSKRISESENVPPNTKEAIEVWAVGMGGSRVYEVDTVLELYGKVTPFLSLKLLTKLPNPNLVLGLLKGIFLMMDFI